jgi:hypothetical protein
MLASCSVMTTALASAVVWAACSSPYSVSILAFKVDCYCRAPLSFR